MTKTLILFATIMVMTLNVISSVAMASPCPSMVETNAMGAMMGGEPCHDPVQNECAGDCGCDMALSASVMMDVREFETLVPSIKPQRLSFLNEAMRSLNRAPTPPPPIF